MRFRYLLLSLFLLGTSFCGNGLDVLLEETTSNNTQNSSSSEAIFSIQRPTLVEANDCQASAIEVNWAAVADANYYEIYRRDTFTASPWPDAPIATVMGTTFTDNSSLNNNQYYFYRIKACASTGGCSDFSDADAGLRVGTVPNLQALTFQLVNTSNTNLTNPWGLGINGNDIYISESASGQVKLCADCLSTPAWSTIGTGLATPTGILASAANDIYVVQTNNHNLLHYNGTIWQAWPNNSNLLFPYNVIADGANLLVADTFNHQLASIEINLPNNTTHLAAFGTDLHQLIRPMAASIFGANTYVADSGNHQIKIFNAGNLIGAFGSFGTNNNQLNGPLGVTHDGIDIYVADSGNHRVVRYDTNGCVLGITAGFGNGLNQFSNPTDIESDTTNVIVVDRGNNRLMRRQ